MNIAEGIKKGLIISVSDYDVLQPLEFCKNDGNEMYEILKSLDYEIQADHKLIGRVKWIDMRSAIVDFFRNSNVKPSDTLLFYYSGHGVLENGDHYLAPSETDPFSPDKNGFLFEEFTRLMNKSYSRKIVSILDCCYSGAARVGKGSADEAAKLGRMAIDDGSKTLERGEGKCILAASQAYQNAFETLAQDHSLFTYYLLEGLKGKQAAAVDEGGYVTPDSLGRYVYNAIMSLPPERRSMLKPVRKVEESGDIALAYYPQLRRTEKIDSQARQNSSARSKDSVDKDSAEKSLQLSDFLKKVIEVEEYIRAKRLEKKEFSLPKCAIDLGISINEVRVIISYIQKNKFQCRICGQRFRSESELNMHIKIHN
jgi:hypothetical protein